MHIVIASISHLDRKYFSVYSSKLFTLQSLLTHQLTPTYKGENDKKLLYNPHEDND